MADTLLLSFAVTDVRYVYNQVDRVNKPCFAGQELGVDEWDDATLGYDHVTEEFVQSDTNAE